MDHEPGPRTRDPRGKYRSRIQSYPEVSLLQRSTSSDPEHYRLPSTVRSSRPEIAAYLELLQPGADVFRILDGTVHSMRIQLMGGTPADDL